MIEQEVDINYFRSFHIISSIVYPSGYSIDNAIHIIVANDICKFYPNELKELQEYLKNVNYTWRLTLNCA